MQHVATAPSFSLSEDSAEPKVVLHGPWRSEYTRYFADGGDYVGLELNGEKGFTGDDLDFLSQLPALKELEVIAPLADDSGVEHCKELRALKLQTGCTNPIEFGGLGSLQRVFVSGLRGRESLLGCKTLESLYLYAYPYEDLSPLRQLASLQRLEIGPARKLKSLTGLESVATAMSFLGVYYAPKLERVDAIVACAPVLTDLELYNCGRIRDLSSFGLLTALRRLLLVDCGHIQSLRPLTALRRLQTLLFYGNTNVEDGNLDLLDELPALKDLAFRDRRHYSRRCQSFRACSESL